jgi:hypothetical protein
VYTSSLRRAFAYADNLRVGNVVVNDSTDYWEAHEPFGGAPGTQSGWGRIGGRYTMLDMTDLKTVVLDVGGVARAGSTLSANGSTRMRGTTAALSPALAQRRAAAAR